MKLAKGWSRESDELYLHDTGARISRSAYRGKMAWWYFPVSLDIPAVEHDPTDKGRDDAFATWERDVPTSKSKSKPKSKPDAKAKMKDADRKPDENPADSPSEPEESEDEDGEESGE